MIKQEYFLDLRVSCEDEDEENSQRTNSSPPNQTKYSCDRFQIKETLTQSKTHLT